MKFLKVRDVKTPERGTPLSAGMDFFVPNDFQATILPPGRDINIPSGIKVKLMHGFCLKFDNKSGVALKKKLVVGATVVDEDYQGEIHLHVFNLSPTDPVTINPGDKLVQALLIPVSYELPEEATTLEELYGGEKTKRGEGGFGSTGER